MATCGKAGGTLSWPSLPCCGGSSHCVAPQVSTPLRRRRPSLFPLFLSSPISLRAVACSGGVWCHGCRHLPLVPIVILSCVAGAGAGAGAIGIGVGIVVIVVSSLPSPFLLIVVMEMVTGPLAPIPPCEQGLAVVGSGCWASVSSSLSLCAWCKSQAAPMIHPMSSFL